MIRLMALAAVAAALILAAAGCGGSSSKSSTPAPATTTTESTDTSGSSTDTSGTDTTSTTTTEDTGTSSTSDGKLTKNCLDFAGASSKIGAALAAGASGGDTGDLKAYFGALADKAPGDVKAAFQTFADAFGKYADAIKNSGYKSGEQPTPAQIQALQQAATSINTPEVRQASTTVQAWVDGGCKS